MLDKRLVLGPKSAPPHDDERVDRTHGRKFRSKTDVRRYLVYLKALYAADLDGILRGDSLAKMQKQIRLDEYQDIQNYEEWLPMNIEGVYERLMEESGMDWRPDLP